MRGPGWLYTLLLTASKFVYRCTCLPRRLRAVASADILALFREESKNIHLFAMLFCPTYHLLIAYRTSGSPKVLPIGCEYANGLLTTNCPVTSHAICTSRTISDDQNVHRLLCIPLRQFGSDEFDVFELARPCHQHASSIFKRHLQTNGEASFRARRENGVILCSPRMLRVYFETGLKAVPNRYFHLAFHTSRSKGYRSAT